MSSKKVNSPTSAGGISECSASNTPTSHVNRTPSVCMSSSLKERLKRCGRYHPATPTSANRSFNAVGTLAAVSRQLPRRILGETLNSPPCAQSNPLDGIANSNPPKFISLKDSLSDLRDLQQTDGRAVPAGSCEIVSIDKSDKTDTVKTSSALTSPVTSGCQSTKMQEQKTVRSHRTTSPRTDTPTERADRPTYIVELQKKKGTLTAEISQKKECLRKLKMVKTYRTKNDLQQLQTLINKWRSASQAAVLDLHRLVPEPRPSLTSLVKQLGIDTTLLCYNEEEECFDVI